MRITFLALSAACAALSVAEAVPAPRPHEDGPKYYFPRVVKKQADTNTTDPSNTQRTTAQLPASSNTPAASTSQDNGGLGDVLGSIANSVVDGLTSNQATTSAGITVGVDTVISNTVTTPNVPNTTPAQSSGPNTDSNAGPSTTAPAPTPVNTTPNVAPTTTQGLGDALSSALNDLTSSLLTTPQGTGNQPSPTPNTTPPSNANTTPSVNPTPSNNPTAPNPTTTGGLLPTLSDILSSVTSGILNPPTTTGLLPTSAFPTTQPPSPTTQPTDGPTNPPPSTTASPSGSPSQPPPDQSTTPSQPPQDPPSTTPVPTTPPSDGSTTPPTDKPTTPPTQEPPSQTPPPPVANNTEPSVTPTATPNTFTPSELPKTTTEPSKEPVQSILPTGTDNATTIVPPTNIATAPPTPTTGSGSSASSSALPTTMPSDVPRVITPEGGIPVAPDNSTLIQIALKGPLHYEFVVGSQLAVSQIFTYLPEGLADGLAIGESKVVMQYLQPYNTLAKLHYITTLCMGYIPSNEVDKLSMELLNANSALYDNPNKSIKTMMDMIDPSVPLLAGQGLSPGGTPVNTPDGTTTENNENQQDAPGGGDGSSGVKPSSVGIAVGAVAGAAVYGAAMFLVARRYKKRKAAHQRASSVQTDETPRPGEGTNLMAGARNSYGSRAPGRMNSHNGRGSRNSDRSDESGRSGRTYISPPVMAENSLGWN